MSHSVKFPFTSKLTTALDDVRAGRCTDQLLIVRIAGEFVDLDSTLPDPSKFSVGHAKAPYFLLSRTADDNAKWALLCYVPDSCPPKERMLSASCVPHVRKECGLNVYKEVRVNDEEDVVPTLATIHTVKGAAEKGGPSSAAAEIQPTAENLAPRPIAGMSHGLSVAMSEGATAAVSALLSKQTQSLTLRIDKEKVVVEPAGLSESYPSFHVAWAAGEVGEMKCFFMCPSGCKVKERMIFASSKSSVIDQLQSLGCSFEKCQECGEIAEVTDALAKKDTSLQKEGPKGLTSTEGIAAPVAPARPKRPGKGPAVLI